MLFMRAGWKRFKDDPDRQNEAMEARSLFLGFAGKAFIKGTMVFCIVAMVIRFGDFNLADVTSIIDTEGEGVVFLYLVLFYGFLFSILLTGVLEGFMFTYAILKNEILGIDEQLRRTFSAALFATAGRHRTPDHLRGDRGVRSGWRLGGGPHRRCAACGPPQAYFQRHPEFFFRSHARGVYGGRKKSTSKPTKSPWKTESSRQRSVNS